MYNLKMLEDIFMSAYRCGCNYVGIRVRGVGAGDEFIINPHHNILDKLKYYKEAYNNDLTLKSNPNIRIVGIAYGQNFDEIQRII